MGNFRQQTITGKKNKEKADQGREKMGIKAKRQAMIQILLKEQSIQTQEELATALRQKGYSVTQATVSRDMKEMHLIKTPGQEGGYRYEEPGSSISGMNGRLIRLLKDCIVSVTTAGQLVVVKTMSGAASTAAEALDTLDLQEVVGSIAGDNTIFLAARDYSSAVTACELIERMLG